jgi:dihydroorotate dehydrogenase electron transfer subunit
MIQLQASITGNQRISPGMALLHLNAPQLAASIQPGQFVLVRCADGYDPLLRRPFAPFSISATAISLLVRGDEPGRRWLAHQPAGQAVDLLGPLGQGFTLSSSTRHLVLVADGIGIAAVGALAQSAAKAGLSVAVLAGAPSAGTLLPATMLPAEVEYRVATADGSRGKRGAVADLLPDVIQWADQICAAGSPALYRALQDAIARHRFLVDKDFAQVWLLGPVACGVGTCLSCTVETRRGTALSCREGPVFRMGDLAL